MTLKIVHHRENNDKHPTVGITLNSTDVVQKSFMICEKIINISYKILQQINIDTLFMQDQHSQNIHASDTLEDKNITQIKQTMDIFTLIFGKKVSLLEAITKTTNILQKIAILSKSLNVQLSNDEQINSNIEILNDEDIDMMVQLVKDFGEEQIRKDAAEHRETIKLQQYSENNENTSSIDVYDVYHDNSG